MVFMSAFDRPHSHVQFLQKALALFWANAGNELSDLRQDDDLLLTSAKLYFSLNRAYKLWRVVDGHNTQPAKIAALTAASIMLARPIYSAGGVETPALFYANPYLALLAGCGVVDAKFDSLKEDTTLRIANWLDTLRINSSGQAISTIKTCIRSGEFLKVEDTAIVLEAKEVIALDMLVSTFELVQSVGQ
jgi:hypothetical protein